MAVTVENRDRAEAVGDLNGSETILLVEDNGPVRDLGYTLLTQKGYTVLKAENGTDALKRLASHNGPVHLLLTDMIMPGMNGQELFGKAAQIRPGLKVLYLSGYSDDLIAHHGILDASTAFIQKPFTVHTLAAKVRAAIEPPEKA